jgi:hypothetical protein
MDILYIRAAMIVMRKAAYDLCKVSVVFRNNMWWSLL